MSISSTMLSLLTGPEVIGRRHRSGGVRRESGRLGHVLLPDLADLQLQLLLVLEDVTVGELCRKRRSLQVLRSSSSEEGGCF